MRVIFSVALIGKMTFVGFSPANAKNRNCTEEEKKEGNDRLTVIANDQGIKAELIKRHLPFGIHKALGPTENERVFV